MKRIYLDYASLTPIDRRVTREMDKYSRDEYANPSSWYKEGVNAKKTMTEGRKNVADFIHAHADEIFFTSGGTEANNLAMFGTINALYAKGVEYKDMHVLVSKIEHSSILECALELKQKGVIVEYIPVDSNGAVILEELKKKIRTNTVLISVMFVNNETGVIQPIREIAKIVRHFKATNSNKFDPWYPLIHTDSAQAIYLMDINMEKLGIDLLTLDAGKTYGPRGIGALYVRRDTPISPILFGGGQEKDLRSGTENIPAIMGFAKSLEIIQDEKETEFVRLQELRKYFIDELMSVRSDITINGNAIDIAPHILNVSIPNIDNEFFLFQLDAHGIACSTKSSCLRDADESYVLKAMGKDSGNSIRFSFGRFTKKRDLRKAIKIIAKILKSK